MQRDQPHRAGNGVGQAPRIPSKTTGSSIITARQLKRERERESHLAHLPPQAAAAVGHRSLELVHCKENVSTKRMMSGENMNRTLLQRPGFQAIKEADTWQTVGQDSPLAQERQIYGQVVLKTALER
jgi:hypothetical protein